MKPFDFAVLIGRFQPFHTGHLALLQRAADIAESVIVVLGSHDAAPSLRNPFSTAEREHMIRASIDQTRLHFLPMADSNYNPPAWARELQDRVGAIAKQGRVALVGHKKDDSSYYLGLFPTWHFDEVALQAGGISSTEIRKHLFELQFDSMHDLVPTPVGEFLVDWSRSEAAERLFEEYRFVKEYRARWAVAPYPPIFVTSDAVVIVREHVLLVRRGNHPGRGQLALPGGFVEAGERIEGACVRELAEETGMGLDAEYLRHNIKAREYFDAPQRDPRGRIITHAFFFDLDLPELPPVAGGDDAEEAMWIPLADRERLRSQFFSDHGQILGYFLDRREQ